MWPCARGYHSDTNNDATLFWFSGFLASLDSQSAAPPPCLGHPGSGRPSAHFSRAFRGLFLDYAVVRAKLWLRFAKIARSEIRSAIGQRAACCTPQRHSVHALPKGHAMKNVHFVCHFCLVSPVSLLLSAFGTA